MRPDPRPRQPAVVVFWTRGAVHGLSAALGGAIAGLIEFLQLLVVSRFADVTDVLLGALGAGVGTWLAVKVRGGFTDGTREPSRAVTRTAVLWVAVLAGYSAFLVAGFLFPFAISHDTNLIRSRVEEFFRVPFQALYAGTEFNALQQVAARLLLFGPLGAIWACIVESAVDRRIRAMLAIVAIVYSALLALGIELAQIVMPDKVADATEVYVCTTGAIVGLVAARRILSTKRER